MQALLVENKNMTSQEGVWLDVDFAFKPNNSTDDILHWIAPLQPRLDWQLWFVSISLVDDHPMICVSNSGSIRELSAGSMDYTSSR